MKKLRRILYLLYIILFILVFALIFKLVNFSSNYKEYINDNINYEVYKVGYLSLESNTIIDNYNTFIKYFNVNSNAVYDGSGNIISLSTEDIISKYDKEYFDTKSLGIIYVPVPGGNDKVKIEKIETKDNTLYVRYYIKDESMTEDMSGYFIIVEINKNIKTINNGI